MCKPSPRRNIGRSTTTNATVINSLPFLFPPASFITTIKGYYHDGLWPVFHQRPELAHFSAENYQAYCQISQHIAAIACDYVCPSDLICVDDYQLLPCGAALKQQGLLNPCGFFFCAAVSFRPAVENHSATPRIDGVAVLLRSDRFSQSRRRE
ncbi:trehalose-6-phosphate synthase [Serratia odorifera]|uniref:trehalose-6-phosphate synthase n=1 Tax=Serratia odorifera TaxID=618 RepID=UPI003BB17FD9